MERKQSISGSNRGPKPAARTPKIVAEMPHDREIADPEEAAKKDGYPGSCQI